MIDLNPVLTNLFYSVVDMHGITPKPAFQNTQYIFISI